jgi:hypothetical protein
MKLQTTQHSNIWLLLIEVHLKTDVLDHYFWDQQITQLVLNLAVTYTDNRQWIILYYQGDLTRENYILDFK